MRAPASVPANTTLSAEPVVFHRAEAVTTERRTMRLWPTAERYLVGFSGAPTVLTVLWPAFRQANLLAYSTKRPQSGCWSTGSDWHPPPQKSTPRTTGFEIHEYTVSRIFRRGEHRLSCLRNSHIRRPTCIIGRW